MHTRQHALSRPREWQGQRVDVVRAQPRRRLLKPLTRLVHGLPHAHDHQRGEHVARSGEVGVEGREADLERAGLVVGCHGGADDREGLGRVAVVVVEGDRGQDYVWDVEFGVDHFDGAGSSTQKKLPGRALALSLRSSAIRPTAWTASAPGM
ncbi:hypothetical protein VP1G_11304 [Cytospora mali]|uniref:Uncharacterized protein n=1 Tax=Cytospora mali TaxID=578113 RepID=A0A194VCK1_CYTMA|nr:hypothetical protein VP1G_11304 [Valsa mali var. pyri (nom. inval.)]